jgi:hypothetical protein
LDSGIASKMLFTPGASADDGMLRMALDHAPQPMLRQSP